MRRVDTLIVGAGQAGLALSHCLSARGLDHFVFERGRVAERWRSERWDSLRLLTPNWQSRLPGFSYDGPSPDEYMTTPEVVAYLERYARLSRAPVREHTPAEAVEPAAEGFTVRTNHEVWHARAVAIATGYCDLPFVPHHLSAALPSDIVQMVPGDYRNPSSLPPGGVLVVGASATGIQLADELAHAGRDVWIAVGEHTRVPRRYRGHDIMRWLDLTGILNDTSGDVYDVEISRQQPSFQLVGRSDYASLDLAMLQARGVHVVGRLASVDGDRLTFADDLVATTAAADIKLASVLRRIDDFIDRCGVSMNAAEPEPFTPIWHQFVEAETSVDLRAAGIMSVLWATGFRRSYPWLHVPVLDAAGEIQHVGGVTPVPGLYVIGMHFLRRRNSSFLDGVGRDAEALADHIGHYLAGSQIRARDLAQQAL